MGKRLADVQKCVRTNDIEDVWDNTHLTFFEMLGNWSLWDYFKEDSIKWSYELLTDPKWFGINPKHLSVTVFEWDENAPRDDFSAWVWSSLWVPEERISFMWAKDNWWAAGPTWPCGPDTEIFYYVWEWEPSPESNVKNDEKNWMEIWNNVFMEFNKLEDWTLLNLPAQNVDTGMWLERITTTLNKKKSVYDTDVFEDILVRIKEIVGDRYVERSARIIADHLRASSMMISDWVIPKNVDQWYILRRLIRRAIREFFKMGFETPIIAEIGKIYIEKFKWVYVAVNKNQGLILEELKREEEKFGKTIKDWFKEFEKLINGFNIAFERSGKKVTQISWEKAFKLYDTYGFPLEMTEELAAEHDLTVDVRWFQEAFEKHQELSRTSSEWKFKWGLGWGGDMEIKYHTVTHLMLAWLRKILGDHVHQAGSNITAERLRFDFTHWEKVSPDQLAEVEKFVNDIIEKNAKVNLREMKKDEAMLAGIVWSFWERYPDIVKIYSIMWPDGEIYSQELCWGPHIESTEWIWKFKIQKEEASSSGVRRIKAILI
jgi:alanyl-tRNA synthetase